MSDYSDSKKITVILPTRNNLCNLHLISGIKRALPIFRLFQSSLCNILYYSGIIKILLIFLKRIKKRIVVLAYHRVDLEKKFPGISFEDFRVQIEFVRRNFNIVSLKEVCDYLEGRLSLNSTIFSITFDDGYLDNYLYAYPFLKKNGIKATIFLPTDFIGTDRRFWWVENDTSRLCLSWEEILELSRDGIDFGSHTKDHSELISLSNEEIKSQVEESKKIIEEKLGRSVLCFCYPYGIFNSRITQIVKEAGFRLACTSESGVNCISQNSFLVKRIGTGSSNNTAHFAFRITKRLLIS